MVGPTASRGLRAGVVVVALAAQCVVTFVTFVLGLVWGGWSYALANVLALLALGGIVLGASSLKRRRVLLALLAVPVVSAVVTGVLYAAGTAMEEAAACNNPERAAVTALRSPSDETLTFDGSYEGECIARPSYVGPPDAEYRHYVTQLKADGWRIVEEDPPRSALATKDGMRVSVDVAPGEGMTLVSVADSSPYD